jgi:hypothetical protein
MGSFGPGLGSMVVSQKHSNTHVLKGCYHSMMIISTELISFIHQLVY